MSNLIEQIDQLSPLVKTLIVLGFVFLTIMVVGTIVTTIIKPKGKSYMELQKEVVASNKKAERIAKDHKPGRWG